MTARPRIIFRPICPGATDFEDAFIGGLKVGRVSSRGNGGSWLCFLSHPNGFGFQQWHEEKSVLAAKNALIDHVLTWLQIGGLTVAQEDAT